MRDKRYTTVAPGAVCAISMRYSRGCGRPLHPAPAHDAEPVCLMHSRDPDKSATAFQAEIKRILAEAEETKDGADFARFVFPATDYSSKTFKPACNFSNAMFSSDAYFVGVTFAQCADFSWVTFGHVASFTNATFTQDANFSWVTFTRDASFLWATFAQDVDFSQAKFLQTARFREALISGALTFRETKFRHDRERWAALDLTDVKIEHPERVEFYQTDLGQALFHNTDVSKIDFTLVQWRERGRIRWMERLRILQLIRRRPSPWFCVFDEDVDIYEGKKSFPHHALRAQKGSHDERNYQLIAETYQQLKRNFDAKGDYWTAGHWHYGEMEMQRLHCSWKPLWARWINQNLSLVALYKYASAYGESYALPLFWLTAVLVAFAVLYPMLGFYPATGLELNVPGEKCLHECSLNYWNYHGFFQAHGEHPQGFIGVLLHGMMTSISVAGFQKELRYTPSYPWGRLLALFELLLTTTLAGLFALAIRRRFKRS